MLITDSLIERKKNILFSAIDQEVVMLSPDLKEYLGMNETASRIWEIIEKPQTINQIIDLLMNQYNVDKTTCQNEVNEFINILIKNDLVKIL